MKNIVLSLCVILAACGGSTDGGITNPPPTPKKPDPWITVRVRDQLDTTTANGRASWRTYAFLTGQTDNKNGWAFQSSISIVDFRAGHNIVCMFAGADSVGQRIYEAVAFADTTTEVIGNAAFADSVASQWFRGDHVLPSGWKAMTTGPSDAWSSQQYLAGHGLVPTDPIRLGFDWIGTGTVSFYERTDTDSKCAEVQL
jgi:hypothetical protein